MQRSMFNGVFWGERVVDWNGQKRLCKTILASLLLMVSCNNKGLSTVSGHNDSLKVIEKTQAQPVRTIVASPEIVVDTVFHNGQYRITLKLIDSKREDETVPNTLFTFSKLAGDKYKQVVSDSLFSVMQKLEFEDYNGDGVEDVLIQHASSARSNWTYHLYLVDTAAGRLRKIKGFEQIPEPHYLPQYNLIDNYVMSGRIWTSFYKIQGNSVHDFGIVIYDNQKDDGSYERDHKKAVGAILAGEKKTP